ncbi:MAG: radical SAM protein [Anaerolineaceae bacterium]|nr:radical SAM protein [Anaerolineaceae bacterium]
MALFSKVNPSNTLSPGLYRYDLVKDDSKTQLHLRVDEDLSGALLINAARVVHLNPSATAIAYCQLEKYDKGKAMNFLSGLFKADKKILEKDYAETSMKINALTDEGSGLCPVCDLDLEIKMPFSAKLSAPYRMDLALTYRCNNDCAHCYNARPRNYPELDSASWKQIIDRLWALRIPHLVFTGGEPTLRADLPELIAYAQSKGMITGLNTNARRLADPKLVQQLVEAGLDHVQITVEAASETIHNTMVRSSSAWQETIAGLRNAVKSRLYLMTNTTLLQNNAAALPAILEFLKEEQVPTIGLNALIYSGHGQSVNTGLQERELPELLKLAQDFTKNSGQRLIWYTPTQYCHFDPLLLDLGVKGCTAAYYNMCIEPDGMVIPCQSYYEGLGKILEENWESIWNHPLARQLRERKYIPSGCKTCDYLIECGGGCPLARKHQKVQPIYRVLT